MASQASQNFVPIREIRNGIVILKDGALRLIIMASSLNFGLKSTDEQEAILFQFQNFLNSLDFSVQFFIQSRELDIRPYIALLEERKKEQVSELMKIQVTEYIEFIKTFTEKVNIMTKTFFVIVPYSQPIITKKGGPFGFLSKKGSSAEEAVEAYEESRTQLEQRASIVEQGLSRTGIRTARLGTEELIELYFKMFNPGEQEKPIVPEQVMS